MPAEPSPQQRLRTLLREAQSRKLVPVLMTARPRPDGPELYVGRAITGTVPGTPQTQMWFLDERGELWALPGGAGLGLLDITDQRMHPLHRHNILHCLDASYDTPDWAMMPGYLSELVKTLVAGEVMVNASEYSTPWTNGEPSWVLRFIRDLTHMFIVTIGELADGDAQVEHGFVKHADPAEPYDFNAGPSDSDIPFAPVYDGPKGLASHLLTMPIPEPGFLNT